MLNKNGLLVLVAACFVGPGLTFLCAGPANAQTKSTDYTFLVASGFLCSTGDSESCAAIAKSANGDSYEISGAGNFDAENKSVKAAGTFNHKSTNGNLLETGVWIASDFISFSSYGIAPTALKQRGPAFGSPQAGPKRMPLLSGPMPTGGLAVFRILLTPMSGAEKTAVLQLNCALGDVPRERSVEGIRLTMEKNGPEFSEEISGRVIFLAKRTQVSATAKAHQEGTAESSEAPRKE